MTDTEKLNKLIEYIRDAEIYHLNNAKRGYIENSFKSMAIQDIQAYMENELGIEWIQLPSKISN